MTRRNDDTMIGIDLSDCFLKIGRLKKKKNEWHLVSYQSIFLDPGLIVNGRIKDKDKVISIINNAINQVKGDHIYLKKCVCALPDNLVFLRLVKVPILNDQELSEAIIWEVEADIPIPIENASFGFVPVEIGGKPIDHRDILLAAISKEISQEYLEVFKQAGLEPVAFESSSLATARLLDNIVKKEDFYLAINISCFNTSMMIVSGGVVLFTLDSSLSYNQLIDTLKNKLGKDTNSAEQILSACNLSDATGSNEASIILPNIDKFIDEINKFLDFFADHPLHGGHEAKKNIVSIILSGRGSYLCGLKDYLSKKLSLPVSVADASLVIKTSIQIPKEESADNTILYGLILRGTNTYEEANKLVNLLPEEEKKELKLKNMTTIIRWYFAGIFLAFLILAILLFGISQYINVQYNSTHEILSVDKDSAVSKDIGQLEKNIKNANLQIEAINTALADQKDYRQMLEKISKFKPADGYLTSLTLDFSSKDGSLRGFAKNRDSVLKLKSNLEKSDIVTNVNSPLANLVLQENINFSFTFKIK